MTDGLQKVRPGDRMAFPASTFNAFVDAARAHRDREQDRGRQLRPALDRAGVVWIKNTTGGALERFHVVGLDGPIFDPPEAAFFNQIGFDGVTPDVDAHTGLFAVLLEPLASGEIGLGMVSGVVPVQLNVIDEDDEFADVNDGDATMLTTGDSGAVHILYKEGGTGTKWGVVRIGNPTGAVLSAGEPGDVLTVDADGEWVLFDISEEGVAAGDLLTWESVEGDLLLTNETPVTPS